MAIWGLPAGKVRALCGVLEGTLADRFYSPAARPRPRFLPAATNPARTSTSPGATHGRGRPGRLPCAPAAGQAGADDHRHPQRRQRARANVSVTLRGGGGRTSSGSGGQGQGQDAFSYRTKQPGSPTRRARSGSSTAGPNRSSRGTGRRRHRLCQHVGARDVTAADSEASLRRGAACARAATGRGRSPSPRACRSGSRTPRRSRWALPGCARRCSL